MGHHASSRSPTKTRRCIAARSADGFRDVFVNPSDIGGRYSALSLFGMVPAALMGLDLDRLLAGARAMECARAGPQGSVTIPASRSARDGGGCESRPRQADAAVADALDSFGFWVEQLVAESTGKHRQRRRADHRRIGRMPAGRRHDVSVGDRVVVVVRAAMRRRTPRSSTSHRLRARRRSTIQLPDVHALGAEFLRWEVATATAGLLMDINPFDEPNVKQAKDATVALLDTYQQRKRLPLPGAAGGDRWRAADAQ